MPSQYPASMMVAAAAIFFFFELLVLLTTKWPLQSAFYSGISCKLNASSLGSASAVPKPPQTPPVRSTVYMHLGDDISHSGHNY